MTRTRPPAGLAGRPFVQPGRALGILLALVALAAPAGAGVYHLNLWPGGVVPYEFDSGLNATQRNVATIAMADWAAVANLTFRIRGPGDTAWVHFQVSPLPPHNYVGVAGVDGLGYAPGARLVNITDWSEFTVVHELGHILGMPHEQNRPDRDDSIVIESGNADSGLFNFNFFIDPVAQTYGPYDFDSIMHYSACAFSLCGVSCSALDPNCRTITVLPPHDTMWQTRIGQSDHLSDLDQLTMSFLYPEDDWHFVDDDDGTPTPIGTFLDPWATVAHGEAFTPTGGTLWIQPGAYDETPTFDRPMTVRAPLGGVTIGD